MLPIRTVLAALIFASNVVSTFACESSFIVRETGGFMRRFHDSVRRGSLIRVSIVAGDLELLQRYVRAAQSDREVFTVLEVGDWESRGVREARWEISGRLLQRLMRDQVFRISVLNVALSSGSQNRETLATRAIEREAETEQYIENEALSSAPEVFERVWSESLDRSSRVLFEMRVLQHEYEDSQRVRSARWLKIRGFETLEDRSARYEVEIQWRDRARLYRLARENPVRVLGATDWIEPMRAEAPRSRAGRGARAAVLDEPVLPQDARAVLVYVSGATDLASIAQEVGGLEVLSEDDRALPFNGKRVSGARFDLERLLGVLRERHALNGFEVE